MRKLKNKVLFSGLFIVTLYVILLAIEMSYVSNMHNLCEKPVWAQQFKNQEFDFIASGSSRAENHVDVNTIEELTGLKGLNIAYGGSAFSENYLALYTFFKNGNKARFILLNSDEWGIIAQNKAYNHPFHGYYYFNELNDDTVGKLLSEHYGPVKYFVWKYLPFVKYAEFNSIYNPTRIFKEGTCRFDVLKGTDLVPSSAPTDWKLGYHVLVPDKQSISNLNRILSLAKNQNAKVILFNSPNFVEVLTKNRIVNRDTCVNIIKDIAAKHSVQYWDFSIVEGISENRNFFFTDNHLNESGAKLFSKLLSEKIKQSEILVSNK